MSVGTVLPQLALYEFSFLHLVFSQRLGLVFPSSSRLSLLAGFVGGYGCQQPSLLTFL
jgi:hypothetical protein